MIARETATTVAAYPRGCAEVIEGGWCCGCGACALICPHDRPVLTLTPSGAYVPHVEGECPKGCRQCAPVCPFGLEPVADETSLALERFGDLHAGGTPLGHILGTYVGYRQDETARHASASGGLASWFLGRLLETDIVDAVVAVAPVQGDDGALAGYAAFTETPDLSAAAGSCYCATHVDEALGAAVAAHGRVAVVGLPCVIKGVRLAARRNEVLAAAVTVTVGLVCGQMKTWSFLRRIVTERTTLAAASVTGVRFRAKAPGFPANRWNVEVIAGDRREAVPFPLDLWTSRSYTIQACDACDDAFAETADVVFMDAWAEPYMADARGHNFAVTRTALAEGVLAEGRDAELISLVPVTPSVVENSQRGVLVEKSNGLAYRLARWAKRGSPVPIKRVSPDLTVGSLLERLGWALEMRIREASARDHAGGAKTGGARSLGGRTLGFVRRAQPHVARRTERHR